RLHHRVALARARRYGNVRQNAHARGRAGDLSLPDRHRISSGRSTRGSRHQFLPDRGMMTKPPDAPASSERDVLPFCTSGWMAPFITLVLILPLAVCPAAGQIHSGGPLGDLYRAREGGLVHYSSVDPTGGNNDWRPIAPGESLTLVDHEGAGVVRRWWITIAPRNHREIQRQLIVRCFWDREAEPSVEVPVADFFGMGFGEWKDYISLPINMTSGGYNVYWPMPFREHARIEVVNTGSEPVTLFYY